MRILFTTQPGIGHLFPLLDLAAGLQARGHDVAIASSASFGPQIAAAGFRAFPVGPDWSTADLPKAFPDVAMVPPGPDRYAWARKTVFAGRTARRGIYNLLGVVAQWRPDLVVREAAEYGGCLAAELLDLPHAVVRTDSGSSSYAERHLVGPALTANRIRIGLPPDPDVVMPFRYLQLSFAPPGLDEPDDLAAPTCHRIRPVDGPSTPQAPPPWLATLPAQPTVYATLGTVYNDRALMGLIIDGLAGEALNVIATVGPGQDPADFGDQPDNVHIERWIGQRTVLPHCDVVVTHGGSGTVSAALGHGVPMVFVPISADQPQNAARCTELGVGRTVGPDERTARSIRDAVRAVLADPAYRDAASQVAQEVRGRPGADHALDLLETLARDRRPLLRERAAISPGR